MLNKKKVALLGAMAAAAMASTGAQAATQPATAEVEIVAAVQLAINDTLDFGIIASGGAPATVQLLASDGTRTCGAGLTCAGSPQRGRFTVSGATTGYVVAINVPASTTLSAGGANTMSLSLVPSTTSFLSAGLPVEFFVGGTLSVGANQAAGNYTGTYVVTADYQ